MKLPGNLAGRALITSATRLLNQGLMVLSPVILVRLLSVEEFGRYREFLLYAGIVSTIAGLGIYNSLLYFLPARPGEGRRFVVQSILFTAATSLVVVVGAVGIDIATSGGMIGAHRWWLAAYVLFFVNLDFWEYRWLAEGRNVAVFAYTSGRLLARMVVVVLTAALTGDVTAIIKALVALEAVRILGSALLLRRTLRELGPADQGVRLSSLREQVGFCLPTGAAMVLSSGNRSLGGVFVASMLGPVALAHYAIGTYVQPLITVVRNSVSDVVLPHMVAGGARSGPPGLAVWRRSTVVFAALLVPAGMLLARFAEPLVLALFSQEYAPAVTLFQIYVLVLLRECFDFSVPLRAIGKTTPILLSNGVAIVLHAIALAFLIAAFGLPGAVWGFVVSRFIEGGFLGFQMCRAWNVGWRQVADWRDLGKVAVAAAAAAPVGLAPYWSHLGLPGAALGTALFVLVYAALLCIVRLPEALSLVQRIPLPGLCKDLKTAELP